MLGFLAGLFAWRVNELNRSKLKSMKWLTRYETLDPILTLTLCTKKSGEENCLHANAKIEQKKPTYHWHVKTFATPI